MAVFSPAALMRVLTTLVDRSLDVRETVSGDAKRAGADGAGHNDPYLELVGKDQAHAKPRGDAN